MSVSLPAAFIARMSALLGPAMADYLAAMEEPPRRSLRVNTLKIDAAALQNLPGFQLAPNGVFEGGYLVPEGHTPGRDPFHAAGLYYMQEASAQYPAALLGPRPGERVLDLCAAPGGKSGQLAALMENRGLLISNEIVPGRAEILRGNLERLGVTNAAVTCMRPDALAELFPSFFDRVLADAPCSGEGMFRRDETAVTEWSEEHVKSCALRQQAILESAALMVRPGGTLVYSTCTFSPEENEENVRIFLDSHPDFSLVSERHLYPHTCMGEGQFAALLQRREGDSTPHAVPKEPKRPKKGGSAPKDRPVPAYEAFIKSHMVRAPGGIPRLLKDGRIFLMPEELPSALDRCRLLSCGVLAGELKGDRFEPAHSLFMACPPEMFRYTAPLDEEQVRAFLAGETIPYEGPSSMEGCCCPVTCMGYTLGFAKFTGGQLKNRLPKGLRIRS